MWHTAFSTFGSICLASSGLNGHRLTRISSICTITALHILSIGLTFEALCLIRPRSRPPPYTTQTVWSLLPILAPASLELYRGRNHCECPTKDNHLPYPVGRSASACDPSEVPREFAQAEKLASETRGNLRGQRISPTPAFACSLGSPTSNLSQLALESDIGCQSLSSRQPARLEITPTLGCMTCHQLHPANPHQP